MCTKKNGALCNNKQQFYRSLDWHVTCNILRESGLVIVCKVIRSHHDSVLFKWADLGKEAYLDSETKKSRERSKPIVSGKGKDLKRGFFKQ